MFIAMSFGLVQGLWVLVHHQFWILTETHLRYPAVTLIHGDPVAMVPQDWFLHTFQQVIDEVDIGADQLKALDMGLDGR